jgi:uncharacterized protein involved in exopolysaccharide biosynthesis
MKTDVGSQQQQTEQPSLKDVVLRIHRLGIYLKSKRKIIFLASFLGALCGISYALVKKPLYQARLSFALEDDKAMGGGLGAAMGLASQFGIDLGSGSGGGAFSGDNLLELMRSRSIVERTLLSTVLIDHKQQTLAQAYISFNHLKDDWADEPGLKNIQFLPSSDRSKFSVTQDSVLSLFYEKIIRKNLSVDKVDKKLSIITVKVSAENQIFAKLFTENLVKTVSDFYVATKTKKSVQNVNILQRQTDSVRNELNAAIKGVATSADFNPNPNPALQVLRIPSQRRQVDVQANTAILTQLVANLEIAKISLRKETPLIQLIDQPILPLEKKKVSKIISVCAGFFIAGAIAVFLLLLNKLYKDLITE